MNIKKALMLWIGFISLTSRLWAHNVWLIAKGDDLELQYGHETSEVYNPIKVTEFKGYDKSGAPIPLERDPMPEAFALKKNPQAAMITVVFDNGYWVEGSSSSEWKNVSKETAQTFPGYHHPIKLHESLYAWGTALTKPIGLKFEIVPLQNPFKATGTLPVQVLFDGKPLPGAKVEYGIHGDKAPSVQTDERGKAFVPITVRGEQFIAVDYAPAAAGPEKPSYATSLRYELK